ncbi:MAG TPA: hypothetical protein VGI66_15510 [Streptosporangiaceae bacterium]
MVDLPLIDTSSLSGAQRHGRECVSCGKRWPRPTVPVGQTDMGHVLYRCTECLVTLEPAVTEQSQLAIHRDCDRSS